MTLCSLCLLRRSRLSHGVYGHLLGILRSKLTAEHDIRLRTGVNRVDPVVCTAGRLSFRLGDCVLKKLDNMVADGFFTPDQQPTEWVSRVMVVSNTIV